jgi:hypothetical protein
MRTADRGHSGLVEHSGKHSAMTVTWSEALVNRPVTRRSGAFRHAEIREQAKRGAAGRNVFPTAERSCKDAYPDLALGGARKKADALYPFSFAIRHDLRRFQGDCRKLIDRRQFPKQPRPACIDQDLRSVPGDSIEERLGRTPFNHAVGPCQPGEVLAIRNQLADRDRSARRMEERRGRRDRNRSFLQNPVGSDQSLGAQAQFLRRGERASVPFRAARSGFKEDRVRIAEGSGGGLIVRARGSRLETLHRSDCRERFPSRTRATARTRRERALASESPDESAAPSVRVPRLAQPGTTVSIGHGDGRHRVRHRG